MATHLTDQSANKSRTPEELHDLFQKYSKFKTESQAGTKSIAGDESDVLAAVRNAVVSMNIKTASGEKLTAPLFESTHLNFPVEKPNEHESHLLTVLSFLIVAGIQKGQRAASSATSKPSSSSDLEKHKKKMNRVEGGEKGGKTEAIGTEHQRNANKGTRNREQPFAKTVDKFRATSSTKDRDKKSCGFLRSQKQQGGQHQGAYQVLSPSLTSYNNKVFLVFALNGKEYGSVVINLRPE